MSGKVLIVDDDLDGRTMLATALTAAGFEVALADDGLEALAAASAHPPDLVVMDAVMPRLDGFDACRALKARPDFADRPVIFMTGLSESEHVVEGFRAGGVDYVTKPVVLNELIARIQVHLANARAALSARSALDMAGRAILAADRAGAVLWQTRQAAALLVDDAPTDLSVILRTLAQQADAAPCALEAGGRRLTLTYVGAAGPEIFFRLSHSVEGRESEILREALALTLREADVLVWIAGGKSNRDISEILNISARTVNKHLEQIFIKLGVENRAAAAVIATRIISAH